MVSSTQANKPANIFDIVRAQLLRPRVVSVQVAGAVSGMLNVDDPLDGLDQDQLCHLMPYEVELLLSPLFTPTFRELEACESALPAVGITAAEVVSLVVTLVTENIHCSLSYGEKEVAVLLAEVVIERYVRLLNLSSGIDPSILDILESLVREGQKTPMGDEERWALFSQARHPVWKMGKRLQLLKSCLRAMAERSTFRMDKVRFLTDFVRSYRPAGEKEFINALLNLMDAYHRDNEHPVYNQQLEHYQGDSIRSQYCGPAVKTFRLTMAHALLADCKHVSQHA